MELSILDWSIIVGFLILSLVIGISLKGKAEGSLTNFFLGGRNLPWYIAGISMVATTFAADTPLAVSELVAQGGVSKNWLWWSFLAGGMLTTFFFSRYWRRANIVTELELIDIRYSGKEAKFLRGFKSVYLGILMNAMVIGWVNLALNTLLVTFFNIPESEVYYYTFGAMAIAVTYASLSGLLGVAITDTVQFIVAMTGTVILAYLVLDAPEVGGMATITETLPSHYFDFFPSLDGGVSSSFHVFSVSIGAFLAFVAVQWWASWYPGSEPGGGGYIAQRMMSVKTEKDSLKATLFFQVAHYVLRPWPWIIVALAAITLYAPEYAIDDTTTSALIYELKDQGKTMEEVMAAVPNTDDVTINRAIQYAFNQRLGYVYAMQDFLPNGLRGLLLVAFLAAYLSTISTQLNMGASFMVNDLYLPFMAKKKEAENPKNVIKVSRISTVLLMVIGLMVTTQINSISGVWEFIMEAGAGLGAVLILRWYWWRINAWSEITGMVAPFLAYGFGHMVLDPMFGEAFIVNKGTFYFTVIFTTISWLLVTKLTAPVEARKLESFVQLIQPDGWWGPVYAQMKMDAPKSNMRLLFGLWISALVMTYSFLFAMGKFIFGQTTSAIIWTVIGVLGMVALSYLMKRMKW
ncbi:MAG: SSS family solute:Na+ symporter [Salibacteraceae bacterium]|jgi:SSS family solute:Na+ symporter